MESGVEGDGIVGVGFEGEEREMWEMRRRRRDRVWWVDGSRPR